MAKMVIFDSRNSLWTALQASFLHVDEEASRLSLKLVESYTYSDGVEMQMISATLNLLGQVFYIPNILHKCGCRSKRRRDKSGGQRG